LNGLVQQISADVSEDQKTGTRYYTLHVGVPENELKRLGNLKLIPAMPVEAFVQTTPRAVFTFLTKSLGNRKSAPFGDQHIRQKRHRENHQGIGYFSKDRLRQVDREETLQGLTQATPHLNGGLWNKPR
jgi:hypothetical protein